MRISIIIPVYNAELYLAEAVQSALAQPETGEVILVEDASSDRSLEICQGLAAAHQQVRLFRHEGRRNCGPSASRNLGIRNATCAYVAFLDNDDYYLPNRFSATRSVFAMNQDAEGVYEAVGTFFETKESEQRWEELGGPRIITVKAGIPSKSLFEKHSPIGSAGYCQLDGLTLKRAVFDKTGLFDVGVKAEDTTLFAKLAASATLLPGNVVTAVAMRRIHLGNNFAQLISNHEAWLDRLNMWLAVYRWLRRNYPDEVKENLIFNKMLWDARGILDQNAQVLQRILIALYRYILTLGREPVLLGKRSYIKGILKHLYGLIR